jgi:TatA/E family protein of Tat protein translocase
MPTPGPLELVIILVIALLILGPGRLPDVGSALGKSLREFRKASSDIKESVTIDTSPLPPDPTPAPPVVPPVAPPSVPPSPVTPAPVASEPAPSAAPPGETADAPAPETSTKQPGSESTS